MDEGSFVQGFDFGFELMKLESFAVGIGVIDRDHETGVTDVTFLDDGAKRKVGVLFLELLYLLVGKFHLEVAMGTTSQNGGFWLSK